MHLSIKADVWAHLQIKSVGMGGKEANLFTGWLNRRDAPFEELLHLDLYLLHLKITSPLLSALFFFSFFFFDN